MIVGIPKTWLRITLMVRGSTLPHTWRRILFTTGLAMVVTALWHNEVVHLDQYSLSTTPFAIMGVAMSIFLGFRNNTSYDRFWEGRKLWGRIVNVSRSFTRQVMTLIQSPEAGGARTLHEELVRRQMAYVHALRLHLRDQEWKDWQELGQFIAADELAALKTETNRPNALVHRTGELVAEAYRKGWVHAQHLPVIEGSLTEMIGVQGGCERIKATPVPFAYQVLTHRIVAIYCITLPFGLLDVVGSMTPAVVALVAFAFYGLDAIGDEIEEPFGYDPNDLPLHQLSRMIEINLRQRLGETELPPMHKPHDGMLD
ncbi:MAG: hypothetical protein GY913_15570 [Proteobacteria bacterium]|nr:hypothetical protein [Pseudomonadota bacterium]MCP4918328.1 hypothetical protein [Pseudomonadota bacterium]